MEYNPPINPEKLRNHYSKTLNNKRILLTAHSHPAWPDLIEEAQLEPVKLAFEEVDHKWQIIFNKIISEFQRLVASRIGVDRPELIANGENTHELITKVMSCFPWNSSTTFVTTDAEYRSLTRQLYRLSEENVNVVYVSTKDKKTFTKRFINSIKAGTNAIFLSTVFFKDGFVVQDLKSIIKKARKVGAVVLLDVYHSFNIRKLELDKLGRDIFVVGGGYKWASGGEGAAWLKVPENCTLRPVITGWFSEFDLLNIKKYTSPLSYGEDAKRFLGATRDMSGICRQIAVLKFLDKIGLTVDLLEKNNLYQTRFLMELFDEPLFEKLGVKLNSSRNDSERGPFLALDFGHDEKAFEICSYLWSKHKILIDSRGSIVRIGPAPYTTQKEMEIVMEELKNIAKSTTKLNFS